MSIDELKKIVILVYLLLNKKTRTLEVDAL